MRHSLNSAFDLAGASVRYQERVAVRVPQWSLAMGQLVTVIGPNGAGKSTLLALLAGLRRGYQGSCRYLGEEIRSWNRKQYARSVTYLPQQLDLAFPFTAAQVVLMGRIPHAGGFFESAEDLAAAEDAMRQTDTVDFRDRDFRTLSGGEKQRVVLAAALAQQPKILLLDEPTSFLDLKHQVAVYELLGRLTQSGLLILTVTHDLNLARHYSDRIAVLSGGVLVEEGLAREVLNDRLVGRIFEANVPWLQFGPSHGV